jgi:MFS family permease
MCGVTPVLSSSQFLQAARAQKWSWYLLFVNASTSGFATLIPLYILQIGGTVREVALCALFSGLAVTLGALFWGRIIDKMGWRRKVLLVSSASVVGCALLTGQVSSIDLLIKSFQLHLDSLRPE